LNQAEFCKIYVKTIICVDQLLIQNIYYEVSAAAHANKETNFRGLYICSGEFK
jgi:hypothetical protein